MMRACGVCEVWVECYMLARAIVKISVKKWKSQGDEKGKDQAKEEK